MSRHDEDWPAPLRREPGAIGAAVRAYAAKNVEGPDEAAAYARVMKRAERSPFRARWPWALAAAGTVAAALGLLLLPSGREPRPAPAAAPRAGATVVSRATPAAGPSAARPVPLGPAPLALPAGDVDLAAGVSLNLRASTSATARLLDGTVDIVLARGAMSLRASPREIGRAVLVTAGPHLLTVVGTELEVEYARPRLRLSVRQGLVAVSHAGEHVATVAAGEHWSTEAGAEPHRREARLVRREPASGCDRFSGEQGPQKVACLRELARQGGPAGERAQHELGRYLRDDAADPSGALAAFEAQRARFPHGELKADADRAIIDLLPRLGRHAEALVETQSFLDTQPDADDRAEIRLLRGDIYRAIFQDATSAEREYEEGVAAPGRTGDDSRFLHALCLEALGRVDEARLAYRDYLAQPGPVHAREAQRRMQHLLR
jgi:hypothetical protein